MISGEVRPQRLRSLLESANGDAARAAAGRSSGSGFHSGPRPAVRSPGWRGAQTPRIVGIVQPAVSTHFIFFRMMCVDTEEVDARARDSYAAFLAWGVRGDGPEPNEQFRALLRSGYVGRNPEHDRFVTPEVIESHTLTGPLEALAERSQDIGNAGVTDVNVLRRLDRPWTDDDGLADLVALMQRVG